MCEREFFLHRTIKQDSLVCSSPERLHLSQCLFVRCWNSELKATNLGRGVAAAHCHLHRFWDGVAHADVTGQPATAQHCVALHVPSQLVVSLSALTFA